jgi:hypothetical protein
LFPLLILLLPPIVSCHLFWNCRRFYQSTENSRLLGRYILRSIRHWVRLFLRQIILCALTIIYTTSDLM